MYDRSVDEFLPLPSHIRPKIRLFLSADIVGSTGFKQERISLSPLFKKKGFQINGETQPWPSFFIEFFSILTRVFKKNVSEKMLDGSLSMSDDEAPRLWKSLGDEVIVTKVISSDDDAAITLQAWIDASIEARTFIRKYSDSLDVKLSAWTAEFPASNSEVAYFQKMHNEGQSYPEFRDALFEFEREFIDIATSKAHLPIEQGILNSTILELYYGSKEGLVEDQIVRDFIGPSIDNGFRISGFSSPVWMPISIELAFFISRSKLYRDGDDEAVDKTHDETTTSVETTETKKSFGISRIDRQRLKGVMGGRPYPIFFIDLANRSDQKFVVEQAYRDLTGNVNNRIESESIKKYCKKFFNDNRNYFYRPFVPSLEESYIPSYVRDEEILNDFAGEIEAASTRYYGQCELFLNWYKTKDYPAGKQKQIHNGMLKVYPLDVREVYRDRVKNWLSENGKETSTNHPS